MRGALPRGRPKVFGDRSLTHQLHLSPSSLTLVLHRHNHHFRLTDVVTCAITLSTERLTPRESQTRLDNCRKPVEILAGKVGSSHAVARFMSGGFLVRAFVQWICSLVGKKLNNCLACLVIMHVIVRLGTQLGQERAACQIIM